MTSVAIWLMSVTLIMLTSMQGGAARKYRKQRGIGFDLYSTSNRMAFHNWNVALTGRSPSWLRGSLIKNGPAQFEEGATKFTHLFDGFAKLAKFTFTGNQSLQFTTRLVPSQSYNSSVHYGSIAPYMFFSDTDPPMCELQRIQALLHNADNCPVTVYKFPSPTRQSTSNHSGTEQTDDLAILSDTWSLYVLEGNNFTGARRVNPSLSEGTHRNHIFPVLSSAHPLQEHDRATYITLVSALHPNPFEMHSLHLVRILSVEEREIIATIPISEVAYMHSFGLSEHYAVLFYDPFYINLEKAMGSATFMRAMRWDPKGMTMVHVVNVASGDVFSVETKGGIHLHNVNTYEENDHLITDFVVYPDPNYFFHMQPEILQNATLMNGLKPNATLMRYDIDLKKNTIKRRKIRSTFKFIKHLDVPTINEAFRFRKYCYIYGITGRIRGHDYSEMAIVKKDLCYGNDLVWTKTNHYPSEATFVASPGATSEDEGVVTAVILDGVAELSYVLILDGQTFEVLEAAYLPTFIPFLIHGKFFPY